MTLAEQWEQQGLQKGLEQGMQQGVKEGMRLTALGMLQEKLPLSVIEKVTGLSQQEIKALTPHS